MCKRRYKSSSIGWSISEKIDDRKRLYFIGKVVIVINIVNISDKYIEEITNLWNSNYKAQYHVSSKMIKQKIFDDRDTFKNGSFFIEEQGKLIGLIVSKINNSELAEYNNCGWVSTILVDKEFQGKGYGSKLLKRCEEELLKEGVKKIILGGEMDNFFSGIADPDEYKIEFFRKREYTINCENHFDLIEDVSNTDFDSFNVTKNESCELNTIVYTEEYEKKLGSFFDKTFPGRWEYEIMNYIREGQDYRNVLILLHQDEIIGFCKIFKSEGITDYDFLYGREHGALGPIGIAEDYRGKGVGNRILYDSLNFLKRRGAHNVLIDWTILKDFYGQFGFTPFKTYRSAYKTI